MFLEGPERVVGTGPGKQRRRISESRRFCLYTSLVTYDCFSHGRVRPMIAPKKPGRLERRSEARSRRSDSLIKGTRRG